MPRVSATAVSVASVARLLAAAMPAVARIAPTAILLMVVVFVVTASVVVMTARSTCQFQEFA
jgi:hypothetical protein